MSRLILPMIILLSAVLLRGYAIEWMPVYGQILNGMPWVFTAIALLLTIWFSRSLPCASVLVLSGMFILIKTELQVSLDQPGALAVFSMLGVMLPCCLVLVMLLPERGLRGRAGIQLCAAAPALLGCTLGIVKYYPEHAWVSVLTAAMPVRPWPGYILSFQSSILFGIALLTGLLILFRQRKDAVISALIVLVTGYVTLVLFDRATISTVMVSAAGLGLIIVMIQSTRDMAYRDELTGLPGRRALNERLKGLGKRYVIAMMDVDHFKKFNDTYGHDMGDEVLKMVARHIGRVKGGGLAFRFGGEEFCVIFPGRDLEYSQPFLEELLGTIEQYSMSLRNHSDRPQELEQGMQRRGRRAGHRKSTTVSVTISIGMAEPDQGNDSPATVLKAADTALYRAKNNGRNCLAW